MKNHAEITSMTTPYSLPKNSHRPAGITLQDWHPQTTGTDEDSEEEPPAPLNILYTLYATDSKTAWAAEYAAGEQNSGDLPSATYTVVELNSEQGNLKPAERLCALPEQEHLATVVALVVSQGHEQVWLEHLPGGTLQQVLAARKTLTGSEVASLAEDLAEAVDWLHRQQLAFSDLSSVDVGFDARGRAKLILPEKELRGAPDAMCEDAYSRDISRAAGLIWLAITGEDAGELSQRAPLSMTHPDYPTQLGVVLEALVDRTGGHTLQEAAAILRNRFGQAPVNLFESVHPSQRGLLTAAPLSQESSATLNVKRSSSEPYKSRVRDLNRPVRRLAPSLNLKKWMLPTLAALLLAGGAVAALQVLGQDGAPRAESAQGQQAPAEESAPSPDASHLLGDLIEARNLALRESDVAAIADYASADSQIARSDRNLMEEDTDGRLAATRLVVLESQLLDREENSLRLTATFSAEGVPGSAAAENRENNIALVNGQMQQKVTVTLEKTPQGWRLSTVEPAT